MSRAVTWRGVGSLSLIRMQTDACASTYMTIKPPSTSNIKRTSDRPPPQSEIISNWETLGAPKLQACQSKQRIKWSLKKNHFSHSSERREKSFPSTTLRPIQHTYCSDILSLGERLQFKCDVYTVLQRGLSLSLYVLKINHGVTSGRTQSQAQHHICWWLNDSLSHIPKENITYTDM